MTSFEKFVLWLKFPMEVPQIFGWFHILCLSLMVLATVFLVWRFHNASDKALRRLLLGIWLAMVILELYKQLVTSMNEFYGIAIWEYMWHAFPFQFCSTPLYALPVMIFMKEGPVRRAFMAFFAAFSLFAGLAVMAYPGNVFTSNIGINIQTMFHHGAQVAVGILLVAYNRYHMNKRYFAGSLLVFYGFAAVAMILNEIFHYVIVVNEIPRAEFNMFYISPYYPCVLPVLSDIYNKVPYTVFLVIYLLGFTAVSALVYFVEKGILALVMRGKKTAPPSVEAEGSAAP